MSKLVCFLAGMLILAATSWAQPSITLSGKVMDSKDKSPLSGVSVTTKDGKIGVKTDANGSYSITVPSNKTSLVFSFVGYQSVEKLAGNSTVLNISMNMIDNTIEFVVTAQGLKRPKKELGYATTTIPTDQLLSARPTNVVNGITGKVAGLQIQTVNNGVNPSNRIILRGMRSLTGNNEALIVLDGTVVPNSVLNTLNPDDIENVSVLKGATAAALYGSDASNGALILTTKKGAKGLRVHLSQTTQFETISFLPKLQDRFGLGSDEYAQVYTPFENQQFGPAFDGSDVEIGQQLEDGSIQRSTYSAKPNERKDFFNTGTSYQNNISVSGQDFLFSFQNLNNTGIVPKDKFNRNAVRLNFGKTLDNFRADVNVSYTQSRTDITSNTDRDFSPYWNVINTSVAIPITKYKDWRNDKFSNPNGYYNEYYYNPYWVIDENRTNLRNDAIVANIALNYKINDWLNITYRPGISTANVSSKAWQNKFQFSVYTLNRPGNARRDLAGNVTDISSFNTQLNSDFLVNVDKKLNDNLNLKVVLGQSITQYQAKFESVKANAMATPDLFNITNRVGELSATEYNTKARKVGYFIDAILGYKNYLFAHGSFRNEETSILLPSNRNFSYYGGDVSAILTEMIPSLKGDGNVLNYAKFRGGIAKVGNVNIAGPYAINGLSYGAYALDPYFNLATGFPFGSRTSFSLSNTTPSSNLKPEFTTSYEAGLDLGFLKDRISLNFTIYHNQTTDQTVTAGVSNATGFRGYLTNAGEVSNNGYEVEFKATPVKTKNIIWNIGFNYNRNESKVVKVTDDIDELALTTGGNAQVYAIKGQAFPVIKGTVYQKDDQGHPIVFFDAANNKWYPKVDSKLSILGNTAPKNIFGFNTSFEYQNLSISATAEYRNGYYIYNEIGSDLDFVGGSERSASFDRKDFVLPNSVYFDGAKYVANTDKLTGGGAEFWASNSFNRNIAENYVTKGDFFKLRELTISYRFPASWFSKTKFIKGGSLTLFGRNLYTWVPKENQYTDPEFSFTSGNGVGINTYFQTPPTKFIGGTISLTL